MKVASVVAMALAAVVVMCHVASALVAAPPVPRPNIPLQFSDPNVIFGQVPGTFSYDAIDRYMLFNSTNIPSLTLTLIMNPTSIHYIENDVCRKIVESGKPAPYFTPLFSWTSQATYNGTYEFQSRGLVDEWILGSHLALGVIDNGTVPVYFRFSLSIITGESITEEFIFSTSFAPANFSDNLALFDLPESCAHMEICPEGPNQNFSIFLFHGANDYTLINTNVADEVGDVFFVCNSLISGATPYFSWVSHYTMEFNTTFGQYGLCNFGSCIGADPARVGQEWPGGQGPHGGQCDLNGTFGNWFSLQPYNSSLCPDGGLGGGSYDPVVGINNTEWSGCGWKVVQKVKTIDGKCLEQRGFIDACLGDKYPPFTNATLVWNNAFNYDNESMGGCPAIVNTTEIEVNSGDFSFGAMPLPSVADTLVDMFQMLEEVYFRIEESNKIQLS